MATVFSSLIGHVDESIEQRASLLAALKAKLDTPDSQQSPSKLVNDGKPVLLMLAEASGEAETQEVSVPVPPVIDIDDEDPEPTDAVDPFSDVMAQLDRGLDARQQMIDALKAQLNKSVAAPKSKRSASEAVQAVQAVQAVPAVQAPEPVAQHKAAPCQALHSSLLTGTVPPPLSERRTAPSIPSIPSIPGIPGIPGIVSPPQVSPPGLSQTTVGTPMTPPQPSGFPLASTTPMTPMTLGPLGHPPSLAGEPPAKRWRSEGVPLPMRAPQAQDFAARESEQAALAARKAQMLRSLGADVSNTQTPVENQAAGPSAPPPVPEPPPGASPEEFEAYRQQCWRQYYQWCKVWQKYYDQSKGKNQAPGGSGAMAGHQAAHPKGTGKGKWSAPQAPQTQVQRSSPEDDIHSQLLGL